MYQVCDHEYVKDELNNFRCSKCDFHATWGSLRSIVKSISSVSVLGVRINSLPVSSC